MSQLPLGGLCLLMIFPFDGLVNDVLKAGPDVHLQTILRFFLLLYGISGSGGVSTKGKRKPRQEEDEDYREFPQKKHKLYGKGATSLILFPWVHGLYSLQEKDLRFCPWSTFEPFEYFDKAWPPSCLILPFCHDLRESFG